MHANRGERAKSIATPTRALRTRDCDEVGALLVKSAAMNTLASAAAGQDRKTRPLKVREAAPAANMAPARLASRIVGLAIVLPKAAVIGGVGACRGDNVIHPLCAALINLGSPTPSQVHELTIVSEYRRPSVKKASHDRRGGPPVHSGNSSVSTIGPCGTSIATAIAVGAPLVIVNNHAHSSASPGPP